MARFFIDRPIFAWVVSILIMLLGGMAISQLPIAQYPDVAPSSVSISAFYSGASAEVVQNTVTSVIEQQLNGIDNLLYINSSSSDGSSNITLTFEPGTNPDTAAVQVQNKMQLATASLPQTVQQQGVTVTKRSGSFIVIFTLSSTDGRMDSFQLGNYLASSVLDQIRRVPGVGEASMFGTEQGMRIWLDPQKLQGYAMTPGDVTSAISSQNTNISVGKLGDVPAPAGQQLAITLKGRSTLSTVPEFENILLRVNSDGSRVLLRDVARVELGGQNYSSKAFASGRPSAAIAVRLAPSANAMATVTAVRAKVAELQRFFPAGVRVDYPVDLSKFVRISIEEVVKTLIEAVALVFLVLYLFLQNFRATLIPTIVVPVALLGTFAAMYAFGFSINVLTMFGLVLAIGILVDDAIVVVENVERIMSEEGLSPREATRKAMGQITGALIGITLVLTAVFIPMAFFTGSVGAIYRQFSLSLVASMLFSVFLAMSLTPALCASLLTPVEKGHKVARKGFFGWFNRGFASSAKGYQGLVARILNKTGRAMIAYVAILIALGWIFLRLPTSFLPEEDQGMFMTSIQLPVGATQERALAVIKQVEDYYARQPEVAMTMAVAGFGMGGGGQNTGMCFTNLKDWDERKGVDHRAQTLINRAARDLSTIKDAVIFPMNVPVIMGLGDASGFDMQLQDLSGLGHDKLLEARDQLLALAAKDPRLARVRMQGMEDQSQIAVIIDETKAAALGVALSDVNSALSTGFGSAYVNNFVNGNRIQRVIVQLDAQFRQTLDDVGRLYVRNSKGRMVPLASFTKLSWTKGSPTLQRYNGFPSIEIVGSPAPGVSTGDSMLAMEELAAQLPNGIGYQWTSASYQERLSGSQAPLLYALSLIVVFLSLAALYESWSIPLAVLLVVPLGVLGALLATQIHGLSNDVYFKVGFLTIIGLSAKNAILIIEFAKEAMEQGKGLIEATLEAVHLRLRPILMTSFAFILGVLPLALASGASSASQNAVGTGVVGGMISATVLGVLFVPVFFVVVRRVCKYKPKPVSSPVVHVDDAKGGAAHE
jgi:multidrug efflux pump